MTSRLSELVTESERARLDLQMLFGVHVYSRAKVVPGPGALPRRGCLSGGEAPGRPGHRVPRRRRRGDDACSSSATSTGRSGGSAWRRPRPRMAPSRPRARPARDVARHGPSAAPATRRACAVTSSSAVAMATEGGRASARCEALARLAIEAARLVARTPAAGRRDRTPALVELVERSAAQVKELPPLLPGHAPWGAQADAALATVALARGDVERAPRWPAARRSQALQAGLHEDASLEIVIPAARAVLRRRRRRRSRASSATTSSRRCRGSRRARPTRRSASGGSTGPVGRELVELAGPMDGRRARRRRARAPTARPTPLRPRRRRAPAAPAPDRGPDERRDRRRARPHRGRTSASAWPGCWRGSAPRAAPRRRRSRSAGSPPWGRADGHPGAGRPPQVHRRRQLHHARPDGLRLARRRLRQEPTSSAPTASTTRSSARPRSPARPPPSSSRTSPSSCRGSCAARPGPRAGS